MVENSTDDSSGSGDSGSGGRSIVEALMSPVGLAAAAGFVLAIIAGYYII